MDGKGRSGSEGRRGGAPRRDGASEPGRERRGSAPGREQRRRGAAEAGSERRGSAQGGKGRDPARDRRDRAVEHKDPGGFGPFARGDDDRTGRRKSPEERSFRTAAEEAVARGAAATERSPLRVVRGTSAAGGDAAAPLRRPKKAAANRGAVKRVRAPVNPERVGDALARASQALDRGYEREALRILRPYREVLPGNSGVRELLGLASYRVGNWTAARKELEVFCELTSSVVHHPVLMDCFRALGRPAKTDELWEELRAVSPGAEVVTEGRIVQAGSLADRGKLSEAIELLERASKSPKRVADHHVRLWYALADLQERAGELAAARTLFRRVSAHDPSFVDVAQRLAALT